jgi:hypothetical protein
LWKEIPTKRKAFKTVFKIDFKQNSRYNEKDICLCLLPISPKRKKEKEPTASEPEKRLRKEDKF